MVRSSTVPEHGSSDVAVMRGLKLYRFVERSEKAYGWAAES